MTDDLVRHEAMACVNELFYRNGPRAEALPTGEADYAWETIERYIREAGERASNEAAARIEQDNELQAELARIIQKRDARIEQLEAALREIADMPLSKIPSWIRDIARAALAGSRPAPSDPNYANVECPTCEGKGHVEHHKLDERICCVECEGAGWLFPAPSARDAAASAMMEALEFTRRRLQPDSQWCFDHEVVKRVDAALSLARDAGIKSEGE